MERAGEQSVLFIQLAMTRAYLYYSTGMADGRKLKPFVVFKGVYMASFLS